MVNIEIGVFECILHIHAFNILQVFQFPGRCAGYPAHPPQIRTWRTTSSGSSVLILLTRLETKQAITCLAHNCAVLQTVGISCSMVHTLLRFWLHGLWAQSPSRGSSQQNVMPGFPFPTVGPLDLGSPPYRSEKSDHRYYCQLRLPNAHLGFVRCSQSILLLFFVLRYAIQNLQTIFIRKEGKVLRIPIS